MQFIKVTKKGNVKTESASGIAATAYFVATGGGCPRCVFRSDPICDKAPCTPVARGELGLPQEDGNFSWDKP